MVAEGIDRCPRLCLRGRVWSSYLAGCRIRVLASGRAGASGGSSQPWAEHDLACKHERRGHGRGPGGGRGNQEGSLRGLRRASTRSEPTDRAGGDGQTSRPTRARGSGSSSRRGTVSSFTCRPTRRTTTPSTRRRSPRSRLFCGSSHTRGTHRGDGRSDLSGQFQGRSPFLRALWLPSLGSASMKHAVSRRTLRIILSVGKNPPFGGWELKSGVLIDIY
jgi:hypothetical protein